MLGKRKGGRRVQKSPGFTGKSRAKEGDHREGGGKVGSLVVSRCRGIKEHGSPPGGGPVGDWDLRGEKKKNIKKGKGRPLTTRGGGGGVKKKPRKKRRKPQGKKMTHNTRKKKEKATFFGTVEGRGSGGPGFLNQGVLLGWIQRGGVDHLRAQGKNHARNTLKEGGRLL